MQHDYYRPASYVEFSGGVDAEGWPSVLQAKICCPSFSFARDGVDGTAVSGSGEHRLRACRISLSIGARGKRSYRFPTGAVRGRTRIFIFWRASSTSYASWAEKIPLEARRRLLSTNPRNARALNVLNIAAEKAGYGKPLPAGHFHGVAVFITGRLNAQIAEVSVVKGKVKVHKVTCASIADRSSIPASCGSRWKAASSSAWRPRRRAKSPSRRAASCKPTSTPTMLRAWTKLPRLTRISCRAPNPQRRGRILQSDDSCGGGQRHLRGHEEAIRKLPIRTTNLA